jgi:hypothetical protein
MAIVAVGLAMPEAVSAATSFTHTAEYATTAAADVASGDVNDDGDLDLVSADYGEIAVLIGDGEGAFDLTEQPIPDTNSIRRLALGQVEGDGALDLVLTDPFDDEVIVMTGDGSGGFDVAHRIDFAGTPSGVEIGNFGGTAAPDLAVTDIEDDELVVLLQDAGGGFVAEPAIPVGSEPHRLESADLDGDGRRDLVVSNRVDGTLSVMLQGAGGGFGSVSTHDVENTPADVEIADLDGDGLLDIAAATSIYVSVLTAVTPGVFAPHVALPVLANVGDVVADDLDRDGDQDLVLNSSSPGVRVMVQTEGSFESVPAWTVVSSYSSHGIVAGHFDDDEELDLAIPDVLRGINVLMGDTLRIEPPWGAKFGLVYGGRRDDSGSFAVRNTGSEPVTVDGVSFDGPAGPFSLYPGACIGTVLEVRETCQVGVGVLAPMNTNAFLVAWARVEAEGLVRQVGMDASVYQPGYLQPDVSSLDFGAVERGSVSAPRSTVIRNGGTTAVTLSSVTAPASFRVISNGCAGAVLDPQETCAVSLAFAPAGPARVQPPGSLRLIGQSAVAGLSTFASVGLIGRIPASVRRPGLLWPGVPGSGDTADDGGPRAALRRLLRAVPALLRGGPSRRVRLPIFEAPEKGRLAIGLRAKIGGKPTRIARASVALRPGQRHRLGFELSRQGSGLLERAAPTRVRVTLRFRGVSISRAITVKSPAVATAALTR